MNFEHRRSLALSSIPITGTYRYKDIFQIIPADSEAPRPIAVLDHHPFVIEYRFTIDESVRTSSDGQIMPQWVRNNDEAARTLNELLLLLTVFSCSRLFLYASKQAWFIPMGKKGEEPTSKEVQWGQQGYFYKGFQSNIDDFTSPKVASIKQIDPNEYFNRYGRSTDQEYDLPNNIGNLFDVYYSLEEEAKKSFLCSSSLFDQGVEMWSEHPSLSFAAMVSSLETLVHFDNRKEKIERCKECGQGIYGVVKTFRDFFNKYGSPSPEFRKYALKVYKYRSKILHRGELFLGEVYPRRFGSFDGFEDDELRRSIIRTCRICLINWLLTNNNS